MKKCPKCGYVTDDNSLSFCIKCGSILTEGSNDNNSADKSCRYCGKCGYVNNKDAVFCIKCGSPLEDKTPDHSKGSVTEKDTDLSVSDTKKHKTGYIAACAVIAVLIAGGAVFAVVRNTEDQSADISETSAAETAANDNASEDNFTKSTVAENVTAPVTEISSETTSMISEDVTPLKKDYSNSFACDEISYYNMPTGGRYGLSDRTLTVTKRSKRLDQLDKNGRKLIFFINCTYIEGSECDDKLNQNIETELYNHCYDMADGIGALGGRYSDINYINAYIADITDDYAVFDINTVYYQNDEGNEWGENFCYLAFDLHDGHCINTSELFNDEDMDMLFDAKDTLNNYASKDNYDDISYVTIPELTKNYMCDPDGWLFSYDKIRFVYPMYFGPGRSYTEYTADISLNEIQDVLSEYGKRLSSSPKASYSANEASDVFSTESFDYICGIYKNKKYGYEAAYPIGTYCTYFSDDGAVFSDDSNVTLEITCTENFSYADIASYLDDIKDTEPRISYSYYNDDYDYCGYTYFNDDTQSEIVYCIASLEPDYISTMKFTFKSENGKSTDYYDSILDSALKIPKR